MKVVMSVTMLREEEKSIIKELQKRNVIVEILTEKSDFTLKMLKDFDVAIIRNLSQSKCLEMALLFNKIGVKTLNSLELITLSTNKLLQTVVFDNAQLPIPQSEIIFPETKFKYLNNRFDDVFVIKPISSSWGRGIVRVNNIEEFDIWKEVTASLDMKNSQYPYLAQKYINKDNYDIRVLIVGTKIEGIFKRESDENWKTNTHLGAKIVPIKVPLEIRSLVNKIIEVTGNGIIGLDLFYDLDTKSYMICEINSNPEFFKSSEIYEVNIAEKIAEYIMEE